MYKDFKECYIFTPEELQRLINKIACYYDEGDYGFHIIEDFVDGIGANTTVK